MNVPGVWPGICWTVLELGARLGADLGTTFGFDEFFFPTGKNEEKLVIK
jgi:hypothetical protein